MRCEAGRLILLLLLFSFASCGFSTGPAPDDMATQVAEAVDATLTASPPRMTPVVAAIATQPPAPSPVPTPAETPEVEVPCPAPGNPAPPPRPTTIEEYAAAVAAYLSEGAGATELESLLREWGAVTHDSGSVESRDMTGDGNAELIVFLVDPSPEGGMVQWPPGEVLIFRCKAGKVVPAFLGRFGGDEDWDWFSFHRQKLADVNDNGLFDLVYVGRTCGAHTCFDRLYVIEWDGTAFVNRTPDMEAYPYPTFVVGQGQIHVDVGGIGSAGAGIQRSVQEVWTWDGVQFVFAEETVGPPLILIQFAHDGDAALAQGSFAEAIEQYMQALDTEGMDSGLFLESEEDALSVTGAYTLFKLVVSHAAAGDLASAEAYNDRLLGAHPEGTPGHVYVRLAEAFWSDFMANGDAVSACQEAVRVADAEPLSTELLYAGYANPEYTPARLCELP